jgi:serine phosphatase RsbU (regulator of sigma subunit)
VRLAGLGAALAMAAALALLTGPQFPEPLFDRYQRWQPRVLAPGRVHVVRIDAESLRDVGPWPWPRRYFALIADRLRAAGAVAVGFDIVFAEADPVSPARIVEAFPALAPATRADLAVQPSPDEIFAAAIGRLPSVIARTGVTAAAAESRGLDAATSAALPVEVGFTAPLPPGIATYPLAQGNVDALEFSARGQGLINGDSDADGVSRRVLLAARIAGRPTAGMALELVRLAERPAATGFAATGFAATGPAATGPATIGRAATPAAITPIVRGGGLAALQLGRHRIPTNTRGEARLWFGTMPEASETSAVNILRQPARPGSLAGQIVLVGPASVGLGDVRTTPLGRAEFGVRFHAQAVDALLSGGWLDRPRWAPGAEWALAALLAALGIAFVPRLGGRGAWGWPALVVVLVAGASWAGFAGFRLLLDPLRPLLVGGSAGLAMATLLFIETGRRARMLRDAALAQAGAMAAAREIQFAMLPGRDRLAMLHASVDLDAVLEPAQQIGGDLYDGFALPDGRIVFLVGDVTGKGPAAALFMAVSKALAHSLLRRGGAPLDRIMCSLNDELANDGQAVVEVTMLVGVLDPVTGEIDLVNAGHENPLRVAADGTLAEVAMEGGLPLATMAGYPYPLEKLRLAPGEALVIITDGVREAQDAAGGFFGSDRTRAALAAWCPAMPAAAATAALVTAVRGFEAGTPASDDLTVMALCWHPGRLPPG